jgi:two-component sensor histidine kinase/PAS domain-containing protein
MSLAVGAVAETEPVAAPPPERRIYPVAIHLGLFAAGMLIPVLLIVAFMLSDAARLRRDDSLHDAGLIAQHLNATIEVELEKAIAVGQTLATALAIDGGDTTRFASQARDIAQRLGVNFVARDAGGQQIANSFMAPGIPLPVSNESILALDRVAASLHKPVISNLRIATVRQVPTVNVVVPVFEDGRAKYFISASIPPARFTRILSTGMPANWIAGVIGQDGRLIARSVDEDRFLGTVNPAFLAVASEAQGSWSGVAREGTAIAGVYIRSPLSGWIVSVAVPEAVLRAPAESAMLWLSGLVIASLVVSTWLGWRLSGRISAPIRDLVVRARELGEGRLPAAARSSVAEVNEVTRALRSAAVELDRRAEAARQATDAVRANEERLQLVRDTARIGTIDWDIAADHATCSPRFHEMFALPPGRPVRIADLLGRLRPEERERIEQSRGELLREGGPFEEEFRILAPNGEECWIHAGGRLDLADGRPVRLIGAGIDITERKRAEEHLRFLLREISHRSKNLLAVILAMASQTAKSSETVADFRRRFGERLMGLSASHDLLVNQNWLGASVGNLVRGQLSPFVDGNDPRLRISGPEVDLKAEAAEALGLALHELATNSLKYGALSDQAGKVEIVWDVYGSEEPGASGDDGRRFRMDWIEHAVTPVSPPSHKGFGRMVIEHVVETTLRGMVTLSFPPGGLSWRIDAPASCLAQPARGLAA